MAKGPFATLRGLKDNSKRKWPGEGGPRPDKAKWKRGEAVERQRAYAALSTKDKLALVVKRNALLVNKGHCGESKREVARLTARLQKETPPPALTASVPAPKNQAKQRRAA